MRALSLLATVLITGCVTAPLDAILGCWKSNEAETLASFRASRELTPEQYADFSNGFFGELEITYRADGSWEARLPQEGWSESGDFRVVDSGTGWFDIEKYESLYEKRVVRRVWVAGDRMWIEAGGRYPFTEYFDRFSP